VFFMLSGMLPYLAVADGIQRASTALRDDRALFDREAFPGEVIPVSRVVGAAVGEVAGLALVVIVGGTFFGLPVSAWLLVLPLLVVLRILIVSGMALIVSILTVFITDLAEVLSLLLTAWLFLTPIFYSADAVPGAMRWLLVVNPLHHIVEAYRAVLLEGRAPFPESLMLAAWVAGIGGAGLWFFQRAVDRAKDFL
jgi:ABC-type polysaccharide/polyol phosphate export permease